MGHASDAQGSFLTVLAGEEGWEGKRTLWGARNMQGRWPTYCPISLSPYDAFLSGLSHYFDDLVPWTVPLSAWPVDLCCAVYALRCLRSSGIY